MQASIVRRRSAVKQPIRQRLFLNNGLLIDADLEEPRASLAFLAFIRSTGVWFSYDGLVFMSCGRARLGKSQRFMGFS
jgi:hypothetical protein